MLVRGVVAALTDPRREAEARVVLRRHFASSSTGSLKALLAAVGVQAHIVAIYSGDPDYVQPDWPSPQQFNHAIAAIVLPAAVQVPAFTVEASLGNVLYFDPTDEFTGVDGQPGTTAFKFVTPVGTTVIRFALFDTDVEGSQDLDLSIAAPDNQGARVVRLGGS